MITEKMQETVATYIKTLMQKADVGQGGNSTNPISDTLDVPLGLSITPTTSSSTSNVIEAKISIAGSSLNGNIIREVGLFNHTSPTQDMIQRINFDAIGPIANDATLEIFIIMEVE
jgi:hypothetical protein